MEARGLAFGLLLALAVDQLEVSERAASAWARLADTKVPAAAPQRKVRAAAKRRRRREGEELALDYRLVS